MDGGEGLRILSLMSERKSQAVKCRCILRINLGEFLIVGSSLGEGALIEGVLAKFEQKVTL